jgi:light-regulated signal transduction histidine kinase (bacteriophytochrome)
MEAMEGGVDDFISKPIDPEELRVRVAAGERVLRLERKLRNQHRTLEEKNAELEQFAYVASHDLKEPLRKINHFAERLVARHSGSLDADAWDYLQRITRAVERMQRLVDDLLTLARVSSTAKPFSPVDLNRLLEDVMSDLEPLVATVGGRVEFGNGGSLPVVMGDEGQLRQLFQNLIGNALKFQRPGVPPLVRIYASPSEASPDKCDTRPYGRIVVEDNGIGFRSQDAEKIFQIFRRLHGRDQYEGTGIGLSVCKKVVQRHQGQIWATGQPNQGAKFTVLLPHV